MFHHPAWAVGSYSSGPPVGELPKYKSTKPCAKPPGSRCSYVPRERKAERFTRRPVGLWVERVALRHRDGKALGMDSCLCIADFALQDGVGESPEN